MKAALTLYELNQLVRETLELEMPDDYWVEAELSEAREVRGHCYMELIQKDPFNNTPVARASAKCWKNTWLRVAPKFENVTKQPLHAGLQVLLKVHADFHEAYGFSWIVTDIDPTFTLGDMAKKRQEIIRQLKEEGVYDLQKELEIPMFAQHVAVISSENAAGYGDFCNQLTTNEYGFAFQVQLFPAIMQGEQVEDSIISALNQINEQVDDFDVVVIIRGGGATADLSGFDTLSLAENVANFPLPIITGIGHERDESVLDMISHTRVKTPTAAASFLIDHLTRVYEKIEDCRMDISHLVSRRMEVEKMRLNQLSEKIPMLFSMVKTRQEMYLEKCNSKLLFEVKKILAEQTYRLGQLNDMFTPLKQYVFNRERYRLELLSQRITALDPMLVLKRGYSITLHNGKAVRNPADLSDGDEIETRLEKGIVKSIVTSEPHELLETPELQSSRMNGKQNSNKI